MAKPDGDSNGRRTAATAPQRSPTRGGTATDQPIQNNNNNNPSSSSSSRKPTATTTMATTTGYAPQTPQRAGGGGGGGGGGGLRPPVSVVMTPRQRPLSSSLRNQTPTARPTPGSAFRRTPISVARSAAAAAAAAAAAGSSPSVPAFSGSSRAPPKSPHVIRAWETKRALTPGRERRKSARWLLHARERDSPFDILKQLSMNLAPQSRPFYLDATPRPPASKQTPRTSLVETPGGALGRKESVVFHYHSDPEGFDDSSGSGDDVAGVLPPPPRMSLDPDDRLDRDNEEFVRIPPPEMTPVKNNGATFGAVDGLNGSTIPDGDTSVDSVEFPRRAHPESFTPRMSFGIRLSDRFHDLQELGNEDESIIDENHFAEDSTMFDVMGGAADDDTGDPFGRLDLGDNTRDLARGFLLDVGGDETGEFTATRDITAGLGEDSLLGFQLQLPDQGEVEAAGDEGEYIIDAEQEVVRKRRATDVQGEGEMGMEIEYQLSHTPPAMQVDDHEGVLIQGEDSYPSSSDEDNLPEFLQVKDNFPATTEGSSTQKKTRKAKDLRLSKHGIPVPSLPPRVIKKLATSFAGGRKFGAEALAQIIKASDVFFENASESLGRFAEHARRKTVMEADAELLMRR